MIRINFGIFSSILGDLVVKLNISKLQNRPLVKTRAAASAASVKTRAAELCQIIIPDNPNNFQ